MRYDKGQGNQRGAGSAERHLNIDNDRDSSAAAIA
jgi:hypothetical protein